MTVVKVRLTNGSTLEVTVEGVECTIQQVKEAIAPVADCPPESQRLVFRGKVLQDTMTLKDYGKSHTVDWPLVACLGRPARPRKARSWQRSSSAEPARVLLPGGRDRLARTVQPCGLWELFRGSPLLAQARPVPGWFVGGIRWWNNATCCAEFEDGHTLHLVKSRPATSSPATGTSTGGSAASVSPTWGVPPGRPASGAVPGMGGAAMAMMQNPEMMRSLMDSPMVRSMMDNPALMESMIQSNPAMRDLMERRPELRAAMTNPDLLRQQMRAALDPRYAEELRRSTDRAIAHIEAHPDGSRLLERMWSEVGEELSDSITPAVMGGSSSSSDASESTAPQAPVADPLPNPWGPTRLPSTGEPPPPPHTLGAVVFR
jgi:hypothetical protein